MCLFIFLFYFRTGKNIGANGEILKDISVVQVDFRGSVWVENGHSGCSNFAIVVMDYRMGLHIERRGGVTPAKEISC